MSERLRRSRQTNANGLCAKQGAAAGLMTVVASVWCHFFVVTLEVGSTGHDLLQSIKSSAHKLSAFKADQIGFFAENRIPQHFSQMLRLDVL